VTLTPHHLLVPWSWKGRAITLLPLWAVRPVQSLSVCTFTFTRNLPNDFGNQDEKISSLIVLRKYVSLFISLFFNLFIFGTEIAHYL